MRGHDLSRMALRQWGLCNFVLRDLGWGDVLEGVARADKTSRRPVILLKSFHQGAAGAEAQAG